jgi:hypothetical protein
MGDTSGTRDVVVAELDSADLAVGVATRLRELGYADLDALTPFPVAELDDVLAIRRTRVRWIVLAAGLAGVALAFLVIHWTNAVDYPLNVGGRPLDSLPADVPIIFETAVLFGSFAAFAGVLLGAGLPRLHHPLFELEGIERTTIDRFWVLVRGVAEGEDRAKLRAELERMGAVVREETLP